MYYPWCSSLRYGSLDKEIKALNKPAERLFGHGDNGRQWDLRMVNRKIIYKEKAHASNFSPGCAARQISTSGQTTSMDVDHLYHRSDQAVRCASVVGGKSTMRANCEEPQADGQAGHSPGMCQYGRSSCKDQQLVLVEIQSVVEIVAYIPYMFFKTMAVGCIGAKWMDGAKCREGEEIECVETCLY
jgi:hypothetical protein